MQMPCAVRDKQSLFVPIDQVAAGSETVGSASREFGSCSGALPRSSLRDQNVNVSIPG
jgi:hypothetical protein